MMIYLSMIDSEEDKSKFEIIYSEYRNLMYYVANKILMNSSDAEDIVHQAFLKVIEILDKIEQPVCPQTRSLLVIITERKAIDLYRVRKQRAIIPFDEEYVNVPQCSEIDTFEERSAVAAAIAMLPTRYRQLILLKYDNGFSNQDISQMLDMTEDNVKKTLQRAKAKLAAALIELEVEI